MDFLEIHHWRRGGAHRIRWCNALIKPNVDKLAALGAEIGASGGPPTEAHQRALRDVQHTLRRIGTVDIVLLTIAVIAMASARHLG